MAFFRKNRFALCLLLLVTIAGVTAVQVRKALNGQRARKPTVFVEAEINSGTPEEKTPFFAKPSEGALIRGYSPNQPLWSSTLRLYETHEGCDFSGAEYVYACADGKVTEVSKDWLYGLTIRVQHDDGAVSVYASLSEAIARENQRVRAGDRIGRAGDSALCEAELGAHLHFEYAPIAYGENLCALYTREAEF